MEPRINPARAATESYRAMLGFESVRQRLPHSLHELVKLRASQINGCAYCVDMHAHDAKAAGETDERLFALAAWREAPYYTEPERAALALTEAACASPTVSTRSPTTCGTRPPATSTTRRSPRW